MRFLIVSVIIFPFVLNAGFDIEKIHTMKKDDKSELKKNEIPNEANKENIKQLETELLGKIEKGQYIKKPENESKSE